MKNGIGIEAGTKYQNSISDEAELPQEMPWSAGSRHGSVGGDGGVSGAGVEEVVARRDTPSWKGVSVIWILLGV